MKKNTSPLIVLRPPIPAKLRSKQSQIPNLISLATTADGLLTRPVTPRTYIVNKLIKEKTLIMFYGPRGIGKTLFLMSLAQSISTGTPFLDLQIDHPRFVLYIDGEMQAEEMKERLELINGPFANNRLRFLLSEDMFGSFFRYLNFAEYIDQEALLNLLAHYEAITEKPAVIILDNISSLVQGPDENSNTEQSQFLDFLRALRHYGHSIITAHHTGKDGRQRGASRREDFLDLSISLELVSKKVEDTTAFKMSIKKIRGKLQIPKVTRCEFVESSDGILRLVTDQADSVWLKVLRFISESKPTEQKQIAQHFKISKQAVSKHIAVLKGKKLLSEDLKITPKGRDLIVNNSQNQKRLTREV